MKRIFLAALVGALVSGTAWGQSQQNQISTEMLRGTCNYPNLPKEHEKYREPAKLMCMGHLSGFFDYHNALSDIIEDATLFCLPMGGITLDTARTFFMQEANKQTKEERATTPAGIVLMFAMLKNFPCK